jgi:hypothetical protein
MSEEQMILVGFGKHSLKEVLSWRGTHKELAAMKAPTEWPPVYRRESICSESEKKLFIEYVQWISSFNFDDHIVY